MPSAPRRRPSAALVVLVLLVLATGTFFLLPRGLPRDLVVVLADSAVVGSLLAGTRRVAAGRRGPWRLLALGQVLNTLAWAVWLLVPVATGRPAASPGLGDVLFLSSYTISALVLAALSRSSGADRSAVLDAAVLATAFGVVLWVTVAAPQATAAGVTLSARAVSVAYPMLDVLLLAAAAPLVLARGRTPRALLLLGWVLLQLVGDVVYGRQVVTGTFAYGTPVFGLWLLSYALLGAAALHLSDTGTVQPAPWWRRTVLCAGLLPLPLLLVVRVVQGSDDQVALVGAASLVVGLLAVVRTAPSGELPEAVERRVRRSLARSAAGFVVLALLPLLGLTGAAVAGARGAVEDDVARRLTTAAQTSGAHVQDQLLSLSQLVSSYADRPAVRDAAAAGAAGTASLTRQLAELEARSPDHVGAWFLDAGGTLRTISPAEPSVVGRNFSHRTYYRSQLQDGPARVSEAFVTALPGAPQVVAVSARVEGGDGRLLGVVVLGYRLDALADFVGRLSTVQDAHVVLTDGQGTVLAGEPLPEQGLRSGVQRPGVAAALAGRQGLLRPAEPDRGTWTGYAPLPALGWAVVAEIDGDDAYAAVHRLSGRLVALATLLGQVLLVGLLVQVRGLRRRCVAEARLVSREAQVSQILAEAGDAFVSMDARGRVLRWNRRAEELFGWTAQEAVGAPLIDLVVPEDGRDVYRAGLAEASGTPVGVTREVERVLRRRDGSVFPADSVVWSTLVDDEPVFNAFLRDITERREHEAALGVARDEALRASRLKSEFVANMSHEIRTPMNGVVGMTTLLLDTPLDERQREFVETLRGSADALLAVLNDVLDFSKIEAGKLDLEDADVPLRPLLEDVVELLSASASVKGLDIAAVVDPALPSRLRTDGHRLRQVLTNLVGNAVKFTDAGEVVLQACAAGPAADGVQPVRFTVRDTGAGISADRQQQLFEAFTQADASTTRRHGGTGLGLTISRQLVRLLGGELTVSSLVGEGSTFGFTLALPVVEGDAPEPAGDLSGVRVLVADDSATSRTVLEHLLDRWSAEVVSVADGRAALSALRTARADGRPFDVALLDARMPGLEGVAVAAAVDADPDLHGTRVVLLSSADAAGEASAPGVSARLTKPVRERALRRVLLERTTPAVPEQRAAQPQRRGRVLVAEDSLVNQLVVVEMLSMLGVDADVAGDGEQALQLLEQGRYDAVLMDCQMPVLDGYDATRRLRALPAPASRTPVVALTASALTSDRVLCEEAGMDDFLAKPLRLEELEAVLARTLQPVVGASL